MNVVGDGVGVCCDLFGSGCVGFLCDSGDVGFVCGVRVCQRKLFRY